MRATSVMFALTVGVSPVALAAQQQVPQPQTPPAATSAPAGPVQPSTVGPATAPAASQAASAPKSAADAAADEYDAQMTDDIVVTGQRQLPGAVDTEVEPEEQLGPADIRSYAVSTLSDLIDELAPETRSDKGDGGAPVILLSGRRISSFSEIRDLPTEAILRVDIFPEEVALEYGYNADQRVINIVLRPHFKATTVELVDSGATEGHRNTPRGELDLLTIHPNGRFNLHLRYSQSDQLLESDRDIDEKPSLFAAAGNVVAGPNAATATIDPALNVLAGTDVTVAGVPTTASGRPTLADFATTAGVQNVTDPSPYRTLMPATTTFNANAILARNIGDVSATLNGRVEVTSSKGEQGLPTASFNVPAGNPFSPFGTEVTVNRALDGFLPLQQRNSGASYHLGGAVNGDFSKKWHYSVLLNYDRVDSETATDVGVNIEAYQAALRAGDTTVNPFGQILPGNLIGPAAANTAHSTSSTANLNALVRGSLIDVPAGHISASFRGSGETSDLTSESFRAGRTTDAHISRDTASGQVNVNVPITSRRYDFLSAIGDLNLNGHYGVDHLSDFGTLTSYGYGGNWAPIPAIQFIVSRGIDHNAPTSAQLGNPTIVTPNVRVFDYVTGETVTVTRTSGGNQALVANDRHSFKLGMTAQPFASHALTITANYVTKRTDNPIHGFPSATAAIEAAFPDRFTRADGQLVAIDSRSVNFAREETSELRYGFNLSLPLKSKLQKQMEAFRNGTGANPFAGLHLGRRSSSSRAPGDTSQGGSPFGGGNGGDSAAGQNTRLGDSGGQDNAGSGNDGSGGGSQRSGFGGSSSGSGGSRGSYSGSRSGGGGSSRSGGGRHGGGGGGAGGRVQFALYHTWHFKDQLLVRGGTPVLDLLHGDTVGNGTGGGQPRHELEAQAGYSNDGLGARMSADYASGTRINGGTPGDPTVLNFGGLATFNLRLFDDFSPQIPFIKKHPWARGLRVTLSFNNVFNTHQQVTDQTGQTPISYQPDFLDPLGRSVSLSIRKLFF